MLDYVNITYEGDHNYKLPKNAKILASGSSENLIEVLAANCIMTLANKENLSINGEIFYEYLEYFTEELEKLKHKIILEKYKGKLIKITGNGIEEI